MGWSYRKSWGLGPVRINLSKRGISVTTGIKGLRIGTRPGLKGLVVRAGRGGFRYTKKLK